MVGFMFCLFSVIGRTTGKRLHRISYTPDERSEALDGSNLAGFLRTVAGDVRRAALRVG